MSERNIEPRLAGHSAHTLDYKLAVLPFNVCYVSKTARLTNGNV